MRFMTPALLGLVGVASAVALPASSTATAPIEAVETGNSSPDVTPDSNEIPTKFTDVREKIVKEYKNVNEIPTAKYFTESNFHYHYDGRFADKQLPEEKVIPYLSALIQTYLSTMESIGAETWIMHGTLLAWWWNQKIFPWDNDLDVQISEPTIHFLADYYNMTEHHFEIPDGEAEGRKYLLEINQHYAVKDYRDRLNVIDARWIDMSSGLFIDITAVRKDETKESGWLMCKDHHTYQQDQIWPLRESYFEDVPAKIPYAYVELLKEEYGAKSLTNGDFHDHHFNDKTKIWDAVKKQAKRFLPRALGGSKPKSIRSLGIRQYA
ncbi:unnamed protein product [Penicillium pancosmium]